MLTSDFEILFKQLKVVIFMKELVYLLLLHVFVLCFYDKKNVWKC